MPRFNLPDIQFISVDAEESETNIVTRFEELRGVTLTDADPRRQLIKSFVYGLVLHANAVDYSLKQKLLSYATDDFLDHLGENELTPRLGPKAATTTVRFELSIPFGETPVIPAGIRVTGNGSVMFATPEDINVTYDMSYVDIKTVCTETGTIGNGFLPNQINQLVDRDPIPFVTKVYNIDKSDGGADWEEDDPYAERIRLSPERYSTAGPEEAYIYHAKSANQLIVDVSVREAGEGTVEIVPLLQNGELPDEAILSQVLEACSDRKVRPLTDHVVVSAPQQVEYDIDVTYYISSEKASMATTLQANIDQAVQDYIIWQKQKLGRGIDPSELILRMKQAGAARIDLVSPVSYQSIEKNQVAKERNVSIVYGGVTNA
ncbi:baseplate assembly protein [Thermaerobacillus caldiproteolyticus]|uniref:baseplate assembly protein n=1 Tax=Thermaerobacillus caldiproteolyticus TaxID=247480 RepID=UPI00188A0A47|nr:baseplate J/gp47 family protein [Anoxybacillus caldiproteolyticus]QPA33371.1 baseplate J/gp47 family protein [Anoxybacillus caldiproteolyticus]